MLRVWREREPDSVLSLAFMVSLIKQQRVQVNFHVT